MSSQSRKPSHVRDNEAIDHAITVFEPRLGRTLTRQEGREIHRRVVGFFSVLLEWDAEDRAAAAAAAGGER